MNVRPCLRGIKFAWIVCVVAACSQGATAPSTASPLRGASAGAQGWIANGATACEKYLTPDMLAAILTTPAGPSARLDADLCHTGSIYIHLTVANIDSFRQELPLIAGAHPMAGVGEGAYWNEAGALSAVKGHDRGCSISVVGPPTKIRNEALAKKFGEICNKLFALP